jgi:hypothetical protein
MLNYATEFYGLNTVKGVEYLHMSFLSYLSVLDVSLYYPTFTRVLGLTGSCSEMLRLASNCDYLSHCVQHLVHYCSLLSENESRLIKSPVCLCACVSPTNNF